MLISWGSVSRFTYLRSYRKRSSAAARRAKLHHNIMHQIISVKHGQNLISFHSFHPALPLYLHPRLFYSPLSLHLFHILAYPSPFFLFHLSPCNDHPTFFSSSPSLLLTHFSPLLLLLVFLRGKSILLLAADVPAGQDIRVTEAEAEP